MTVEYRKFFVSGEELSSRQIVARYGITRTALYKRWMRGDRGLRLVRPMCTETIGERRRNGPPSVVQLRRLSRYLDSGQLVKAEGWGSV